jgi:hypothetical protein
MIKADSLGDFDKGNVEAFKILSRDANDAYARYIALRYLSLFKLEIEGNKNPEKLEAQRLLESGWVPWVHKDSSIFEAEELFPKSPSISFSKLY